MKERDDLRKTIALFVFFLIPPNDLLAPLAKLGHNAPSADTTETLIKFFRPKKGNSRKGLAGRLSLPLGFVMPFDPTASAFRLTRGALRGARKRGTPPVSNGWLALPGTVEPFPRHSGYNLLYAYSGGPRQGVI